MSASLVGSEMCIRDSPFHETDLISRSQLGQGLRIKFGAARAGVLRRPVSYTHLTLPTICSV
eukprot:10806544-Alexandrium_andersonii.AAC.1